MRLEVTVNFQPIMGTLRGPGAQKYAATEAIKYMEDYQGVVRQDYNYAKLLRLKKENVSLNHHLKKKTM